MSSILISVRHPRVTRSHGSGSSGKKIDQNNLRVNLISSLSKGFCTYLRRHILWPISYIKYFFHLKFKSWCRQSLNKIRVRFRTHMSFHWFGSMEPDRHWGIQTAINADPQKSLFKGKILLLVRMCYLSRKLQPRIMHCISSSWIWPSLGLLGWIVNQIFFIRDFVISSVLIVRNCDNPFKEAIVTAADSIRNTSNWFLCNFETKLLLYKFSVLVGSASRHLDVIALKETTYWGRLLLWLYRLQKPV